MDVLAAGGEQESEGLLQRLGASQLRSLRGVSVAGLGDAKVREASSPAAPFACISWDKSKPTRVCCERG